MTNHRPQAETKPKTDDNEPRLTFVERGIIPRLLICARHNPPSTPDKPFELYLPGDLTNFFESMVRKNILSEKVKNDPPYCKVMQDPKKIAIEPANGNMADNPPRPQEVVSEVCLSFDDLYALREEANLTSIRWQPFRDYGRKTNSFANQPTR